MRNLAIVLIALILMGCATTHKDDAFSMFGRFVDRRYAEPLEEAFGDTIPNRGIRYSVLSNLWSPVPPNTLSMNENEALYAETIGGEIIKYHLNVSECEKLKKAVMQFYERLPLLFDYATGNISYENPAQLDGPDYVIEYWSKNANIYIQPIGFPANFPLVKSANNVVAAIKTCA